ncbi:M36 family metallopeptidase [Bacillus cereus]|uniref:M36 family metallopeptidase n=2 Tax=Bacillus cereus group TaxID=86661 RepID=A0AB73URP2_BACCE|nr:MULTISPECIES: M36 family metallopeptidase [Bacillus]MCU7389422.1 M36 family metallopeptidase [Bacillus sp. ST24]AHX18313.1 peptidase M36 [Bacillus bombysepticus str. Wang]EKS8358790.1 M36 family metallopeptidase [Bacillus cereus]MBK0076510.1 M36 family metallopeptidase [Bacillus sp. S56]MCE9757085.1 M36 family metallopeptidase [Bacillus cereus]
MFNKKMVAMAMTVPLVMGTISTVSALEKQQQVKLEAYSPQKKATEYLKENAAQYGLKTDLSDLQYISTTETSVASYVRFQQVVNGAPVFSKQITVTLNGEGKGVLAVSDYQPVTGVKEVTTKISEKDAIQKSMAYVGEASEQNLWAPTDKEFGYIVEEGIARPVYKVVVHSNNPFGAWETFIDAENGKLIKKVDINRKAEGSGKVFLPNPVVSSGSKVGLKDNNDADSTALTNQLKTVTLKGLDGTGFLIGEYVTISSKAKTKSTNLQFNYTRANDSFEDVMSYYHIDTLQRYIQSLGFKNINNRSIKVNVNGTTADNSFYSPTTKALTFGTGGVDDAEDAGIIAHEYGHSIQDNQVPGFGSSAEGGAMGEGFGDFLGATYEDAVSTTGYGKACVGEWDATAYSSSDPTCLRRLDTNKVYPKDITNEVHDDGEIWAQGQYEMAQAFGRDVATKIILQSHWSLTPNSKFSDGAKAIKQADALLYGGQHAADIDRIWAARGISTN